MVQRRAFGNSKSAVGGDRLTGRVGRGTRPVTPEEDPFRERPTSEGRKFSGDAIAEIARLTRLGKSIDEMPEHLFGQTDDV